MKLAQNELNLFDNPWKVHNSEGETVEFFTVDDIESNERVKLDSFLSKEENRKLSIDFSFRILLSSNKYIHERKSQTVLNIIGDVGGFNDAILLLFGPLILLYSSKKFDLSVPEGAPVLLKSQVKPTRRDRQQ